MAISFRKKVKVTPHIGLNISKSGVSVSTGVRGAKINIGSRGVYGMIGAPGTGIYYRTKLNKKPKVKSTPSSSYDKVNNEHGCLCSAINIFCGFVSIWGSIIVFILKASNSEYYWSSLLFVASCIIIWTVYITYYKYRHRTLEQGKMKNYRKSTIITSIVLLLLSICLIVVQQYNWNIVLLYSLKTAIFIITLILASQITKLIISLTKSKKHISKTSSNIKQRDIIPNNDVQTALVNIPTPEQIPHFLNKVQFADLSIYTNNILSVRNYLYNNTSLVDKINAKQIVVNHKIITNIQTLFKYIVYQDLISCYAAIYNEFCILNIEGEMLLEIVVMIDRANPNLDYDAFIREKDCLQHKYESLLQDIYIGNQDKNFTLLLPDLLGVDNLRASLLYMASLYKVMSLIAKADRTITVSEKLLLTKISAIQADFALKYKELEKLHAAEYAKQREEKLCIYENMSKYNLDGLFWDIAHYISLRGRCDMYEIGEDFHIDLNRVEQIREQLEKMRILHFNGFGNPTIAQSNVIEDIKRQCELGKYPIPQK